ncbi:putative disease resistance protein [Camellia lanceoleosa]|uniref:Disease resistance protein n=1 Tax=Camellia lanceoleosa TaxID=1840588 RepID=A0ACC0IG73_9ERIC|nr:putative disease resistance protein [Camellia lanceoleosa]
MPSWMRLEIRECSALMASLPRTSVANKLVLNGCNGVDLGCQGVSSLVKLEISNMPNLKELTPEMYMLTNLQELIIGNCPSLVSFPHTGLPLMLTSLLVRRCEALDSVNVCLNTRLQKLFIANCSSLCSFVVGVLPITVNSIYISECPKLVFSLSEQMECCNSSLEHLMLRSCGTLESLSLGFFPKLQTLDITNFEILSIPNGHGLKNSTSLESISIFDCNSMVSCLQEALHASNLKTFQVFHCKKLKLLPEGMHSHFPSLEELIIWNCPEIESFPEGGLPSNLRQLQIWGCKKLVDCRREWGLQRLPSLREFTFGGGKYKEEDDTVLESFLEEALLPLTLTSLLIKYLKNLKSINYQSFQHLTCLKRAGNLQLPSTPILA